MPGSWNQAMPALSTQSSNVSPNSRARAVSATRTPAKGTNPRFIVTSLKTGEIGAQTLYEELYCQRGEMENRIKECQLDLFADRTSARTMRANQLRLWFASFAYVLIEALRRRGLRYSRLENTTCGTIRLKLLKIGAVILRNTRRVRFQLATACPYRDLFTLVARRLAPD